MKAKKKNAVASGTPNNPPAAPTAPAPTAPAPNHPVPPATEQQDPPKFVDLNLDESDSSKDWCAEDARPSELEYQAGTDSDSELEEASEGAKSPSNALSEILEQRFFEKRDYSPLDLTDLLRESVLRDIRQEGVDRLKEAIQRSGWIQSLMIAHDRENERPPVLLEGAHRARALVELYREPGRLAHPLHQDLKVTVVILRGLFTE